MNTMDSASIDIPCPGCGQKVSKTIGWLKSHPNLVCPGCGAAIRVDPDQLRKITDGVNKALDNLRRTLGKLGK